MSTFTQIYYHIVFSTKNREPHLAKDGRDDLFKYIWGILRENKSHLYRINAVDDHVHFLTSLHPTVCLADLVKDVKIASSGWIKEKGAFPGFANWQNGYGAFTHSAGEKDALIEYIKRQEDHHRKITFREELERLLKEAGIEYDEKFLL
jgi:putative transposase